MWSNRGKISAVTLTPFHHLSSPPTPTTHLRLLSRQIPLTRPPSTLYVYSFPPTPPHSTFTPSLHTYSLHIFTTHSLTSLYNPHALTPHSAPPPTTSRLLLNLSPRPLRPHTALNASTHRLTPHPHAPACTAALPAPRSLHAFGRGLAGRSHEGCEPIPKGGDTGRLNINQ